MQCTLSLTCLSNNCTPLYNHPTDLVLAKQHGCLSNMESFQRRERRQAQSAMHGRSSTTIVRRHSTTTFRLLRPQHGNQTFELTTVNAHASASIRSCKHLCLVTMHSHLFTGRSVDHRGSCFTHCACPCRATLPVCFPRSSLSSRTSVQQCSTSARGATMEASSTSTSQTSAVCIKDGPTKTVGNTPMVS